MISKSSWQHLDDCVELTLRDPEKFVIVACQRLTDNGKLIFIANEMYWTN